MPVWFFVVNGLTWLVAAGLSDMGVWKLIKGLRSLRLSLLNLTAAPLVGVRDKFMEVKSAFEEKKNIAMELEQKGALKSEVKKLIELAEGDFSRTDKLITDINKKLRCVP